MRGFTVHEIRESDPVRFLDTLNRTLYKKVLRMNIDRNLTLAILNYTDRKVSISGQPEKTPIVRARGVMEHRHDRFRTAIALDENITDFIDRECDLDLHPGDGIVLYTDGIIEAKNMDRAQYG